MNFTTPPRLEVSTPDTTAAYGMSYIRKKRPSRESKDIWRARGEQSSEAQHELRRTFRSESMSAEINGLWREGRRVCRHAYKRGPT